jgi:outer membrane beta-barrel protein
MRWSLFVLLFASFLANAAETAPDFDSLGGNSIMLERARALEPEKNVRVVQTRTVDRRHRFEFAPEFTDVFGGETYIHTKTVGLNANYHITNRFSVGVKYGYAFNELSNEGQRQVRAANDEFAANPEHPTQDYPHVNYVKDQVMALANWYPIYGKINLLDKKVIHFDVYALGGYGSVRLEKGTSPTYAAGGGIGFWFTPHLTTRLEMRYQNYSAKVDDRDRNQDLTVGSVQMGWLL